MTTPADSQLEAACPFCRATIPLPADPEVEHVRCRRCNEKIPLVLLETRVSTARTMVSQASTAAPPAAAGQSIPSPPKPPPPPPKEVRVICKLCGTIVYAPVADIGKQIQCPDCESMNVVPPLPKPKKKVDVKLEQQDSFRLAEGVDQLDPHSAASQQKWYTAKCPVCFTDIRLTVDMAGKPLQCPDCLTSFTAAQPPAAAKPGKKIALDDTDELKLSDPVERPPLDVENLIAIHEVPLGRELQAAASSGGLDTREKLETFHELVKGEQPPEGKATAAAGNASATAASGALPPIDSLPAADALGQSLPSDGDAAEAAPAPRRRRFRISAQTQFLKKLLFSGMWRFSSEHGLIARFMVLALMLAVTLWIGSGTVQMLQGEMTGVAEGAIMAAKSLFSALLLLLSLVITANTFLPIVVSAGLAQDEVEDWPPLSPGEWLFQTMYIINALAIGALPTIMFVPFLSVPVLALLQWLTMVPIFPLAILSMLDEGSPFAPYAPGLWRLVTVHWGLWLRFTAVGYVVGGLGLLLGLLTVYTESVLLAIFSAVLIAALVVIYGRFLGRMAMFMSDQSIQPELDDEE